MYIQCHYQSYYHIINRISLTKFRLSNHRLLVETGRHQHLKMNLRFCPFCPRSIEDEFHSLLECQVYKILRKDLFIEANNKVKHFLQKGNREKFITLLTNPAVMPYTASYLHRMFNCRDFLLKKTQKHRVTTINVINCNFCIYLQWYREPDGT